MKFKYLEAMKKNEQRADHDTAVSILHRIYTGPNKKTDSAKR